MIDPASFRNVRLHGGFVIAEVEFTSTALVDALEREAIAQTRIVGKTFRVTISEASDERDVSISLYHEILEAAAVASEQPPKSVIEFNEADFEKAAQAAHAEFGNATPENLNRMLQTYGFREE
jgi:hypothetical protein